ncbi:MAG: hypothetical protein ABSB59_10140 [Streptosporangiaceae bacterium]
MTAPLRSVRAVVGIFPAIGKPVRRSQVRLQPLGRIDTAEHRPVGSDDLPVVHRDQDQQQVVR